MDIEAFLKQHNISYEKHTHPVAYTAQELAHAEHVTGYMVAKPVIVRGERGFAMCVLAAPKQLDLERAAAALGEKQVRLATEDEMRDLFPGCELGAEPPIGPLYNLPMVIDEGLLDDEFLVMQAGSHTTSMRLRREDWQRACNPKVAAIARG